MAYIAYLDPNNSDTAARIAREEEAYYNEDPRALDPEDIRVPVAENDMTLVSAADRQDWIELLDWLEFHR